MNITIQSIPHDKQRYETVGDWVIDPKTGDITILVSDTGDDDYNVLVALHELIEVLLCQKRGITQKAVDEFDVNFESERKAGLHEDDEEPGDAEDAPYRKEHFFATNVERLMAAELGVVWQEYDDTVNSL